MCIVVFKMINGYELNGELIKEWRDRAGVKNAYLARYFGCSESYVGKLLAGERPPTDKWLKQAAELLGMRPKDLLRESRKTA